MLSAKRVKEIIVEELNSMMSSNKDINLSSKEIFRALDTNKDNVIDHQELEKGISWYCSNPHIVKPYEKRRSVSHNSVPCKSTYDKASKYLMHNVDNVYSKSYQDVQIECGAECPVSVITAVLDIMYSLENIEK
jgi:hypothetical protein